MGLIYVAAQKGFFKAEGLSVTLQPHTSGKACLQAILAGKADLGTVAETPVMHACMDDASIYTVATILTSGKNTVVVARKDLGIATTFDLKGRRIGVTLGTNAEFFLETLLVTQGIAKTEVEKVTSNRRTCSRPWKKPR